MSLATTDAVSETTPVVELSQRDRAIIKIAQVVDMRQLRRYAALAAAVDHRPLWRFADGYSGLLYGEIVRLAKEGDETAVFAFTELKACSQHESCRLSAIRNALCEGFQAGELL